VLRDQPNHVAALNLLSILLTHREQFIEAEHYVKSALKINSSSDATFYNYGIILKALNRPEEALTRFKEALALNPANAETWNNCGTVLNDLRRFDDAIEQFDKALGLQPDYPQAFSNKARSLALLRRYDESAAAYEKALTLNPSLAEAWVGLGNVRSSLKRPNEARVAFRRALDCKPGMFEAHDALVVALLSEGKVGEALTVALGALAANETLEAKLLVASCLRSPFLQPSIGDLRDLLTRALTEPWGPPAVFSPAAALFLILNEAISDGMARAAKAWPKLLPVEDLTEPSILAKIADDRLLRALLESTPACVVALEQLLTGLRAGLLAAAASGTSNAVAEPALGLYCALARQCFINGYVFAQSDAEIEQVRVLREAAEAALGSGATLSALSLVAIAAYVPLHTLSGAGSLLDRSWPAAINAVLDQQLRAPLEEQRLRALMPALTTIDNDVSIEVRSQYEESPYPQWVKLAPAAKRKTVDAYMRENFPLSPFVDLGVTGNVDVLVAGCGTGQHSIGSAERFEGARVLAIDLSLSSLCYAQRQTRMRGLTNVQYAQADIMNLPSIGRTFDIIESVGVLHHLADPFAGWRLLLSMLRPRGIMALGFYSEIARRVFAPARDVIAARGYRPIPHDIRKFRQEVFNCADDAPLRKVLVQDFFSLNECRDLLFHVEEHRLTLPEIAGFIEDNNLQFLGFEADLQTKQAYERQFPDDAAQIDLAQWHRYETDNPHAFMQMYLFWVQKK